VTRAAWAASLLLTVGVGGVAAEPDRDAGAEAPDAGSETPRGEFDSNDPTTWDLPPAVPRPDFMRNRSFIPDELLREKREGRYFTAIPAIGWDAEEGFNLGAFVEFFDNGSREDPFFRTAPYRQSIIVGGIATTEEVVRILGRLDQPYIGGSPYRLRIGGLFEHNPIRNYFGVGEDGLQDLNYPGSAQSFGTYEDFLDSVNRVIPSGQPIGPGLGDCPAAANNCTWSRYSKYKAVEAFGVVTLERDTFGGIVRPLVGYQVRYTSLEDYTGDRIDPPGGGGRATQLPTKLAADCAAGIIDGCNGGFDNFLKLGISYDTRNFEPDPTRGVLVEAVGQISTRFVGSNFEYQRLTLSGNVFHSPIPDRARLILVGRAVYNMQFGEVPFWALSTHAFTGRDRNGLGGFDTLRGYKRERFIGDSTILLNAELRWALTEWRFLGQHLRPYLAPFVDTGRSFDGIDLKFEDWKVGFGLGFRLAWNLSTVISFDFGVSSEDRIFYMELGTQL
jgi:hypothetical protein